MYSVVDMRLNGGLGDVTIKNQLLIPDVTEHVTATAGCLDDSWWIIAKMRSNSEFVAFNFNAGGVNTTPVRSQVGMSQQIRDVGTDAYVT